MHRPYARPLGALLLTLAVLACAPASAGAQSWNPTNWTITHPPVLGMEFHPFEFDADWAPGAPLTKDLVDYIAWSATEGDFKSQALAEGWTEAEYYNTLTVPPTSTGLTGTSYTGPDAAGGWRARIVRWMPSTPTREGYYCVYSGHVPQEIVGDNTFVQSDANCGWFDWPGTGLAWDRPTPAPLPPHHEAHNQDACAGLPGACATIPAGWTSQKGGVDKLVLDQLAIPHWTANKSYPYTGQVGDTATSGYPGNWNVTVTLYNTAYGPLGLPYRCRYFARVTGSETVPVVAQIAEPSCGYYAKAGTD